MNKLIQERTVVLSTNDNPKYYKYLRDVQKAWNALGWKTLTFWHGQFPPGSTENNQIVDITGCSSKYRDETVVQCIRLFGGRYIERGIIMSSDADMIPLCNYWDPQTHEITVYGYDLTGRTQFPMCYIAMNAEKWRTIIPERSINELLDKYPDASNNDWDKWWIVDQHIITERLKKSGWQIKHVFRGFDVGLALGRIDRHDWVGTLNRPGTKIDAHMPHPFDPVATKQAINVLKSQIYG